MGYRNIYLKHTNYLFRTVQANNEGGNRGVAVWGKGKEQQPKHHTPVVVFFLSQVVLPSFFFLDYFCNVSPLLHLLSDCWFLRGALMNV